MTNVIRVIRPLPNRILLIQELCNSNIIEFSKNLSYCREFINGKTDFRSDNYGIANDVIKIVGQEYVEIEIIDKTDIGYYRQITSLVYPEKMIAAKEWFNSLSKKEKEYIEYLSLELNPAPGKDDI